ncbi:hypothetical protein C8J56DRAFT_342816 [Mycena floridula]|nr:hypothetical protein C8J56DRAFT_342816 [Mycena floridula]
MRRAIHFEISDVCLFLCTGFLRLFSALSGLPASWDETEGRRERQSCSSLSISWALLLAVGWLETSFFTFFLLSTLLKPPMTSSPALRSLQDNSNDEISSKAERTGERKIAGTNLTVTVD